MSKERTPTDGEPYYCALCGLGFAEFMACEEPDCKLEDWETARKRVRGSGRHHNHELTTVNAGPEHGLQNKRLNLPLPEEDRT